MRLTTGIHADPCPWISGFVDFKHGFVFAIFDSFAHKYEPLKMKGSFGRNDK